MKIRNLIIGLFLIGITGQVQANEWLSNGLVAFYPFNGNANDASGNGNNGVMVGEDLKFSFDGQRSNSLSLNMATRLTYWHTEGSYVKAPSSLDFNKDYTMSIWVNVSSRMTIPFPENFISNGPDDNLGVNVRLLVNWTPNGDTLQFGVGANGIGISQTIPPIRDQWWHIAVVYSANKVSMYTNGVFLADAAVLSPVTTSEIYFGKHMSWFSYCFAGGMDDIRLYNRAFTPADMQQLYAYESEPKMALMKTVIPSFSNLCVGLNYQLQVSSDLNTWTNSGSPFLATSNKMVCPQYWEIADWNKLFFRVQKAQ